MDIIQLYNDYSIPTAPDGHKHSRVGWINTTCPWCTGTPGFHLGFELQNQYYYCWRCGWHPIVPTLARITSLSEFEVKKLIKQYGLYSPVYTTIPTPKEKKEHRMPSNIGPLSKAHEDYLLSRNFDPDKLKKLWFLLGTGPVSLLDGTDYKNRIIAPVIWNAEQVSFQGRAISKKVEKRYMACPESREIIHHKYILYGRQEYWGRTGIIVEGITDVWRFGLVAAATFGIEYTPKQLKVIANSFDRIAVCFDDEPQAIAKAEQMISDLKFRGKDAFRIPIVGDPGEMDQSEADYLVKQII